MPQFDIDRYLASRVAAVDDKIGQLEQASQAKKAQLAQRHAEAQAQELARRQEEERNANSLVSRFGLDPEGVVGGVVNLGANLIEGAVNVPKNIATTIHTARALEANAGLPDQVKVAQARVTAGQGTPEDYALLNLPAGDAAYDPGLTSYQRAARLESRGTNKDQIAKMEGALRDAAAVRDVMDASGLVHRGKQDALIADLREGYQADTAKMSKGWEAFQQGDKANGTADMVSGLAGLLANIGSAAVKNPGAASEYIVANIPQMLLASQGTAGMAMTNIPYAAEEFGKGIDAYRKANNGAIPPQDELQRMGQYAASLAIAETVGDKAILMAGKAVNKTSHDVVEDVVRHNFKQALIDSHPVKLAKAMGEGAAGEFLTEGYQTYAENEIQNKPTTAEDAYVGGALGAISGSGIAGSVYTGAELAAGAGEQAEKLIERATQQQAREAAAATGDVSALLDPTSKTYAPDAAIAALYGNSQQADTTEAKQGIYEQAAQILGDLETQRDEIAKVLASARNPNQAKQDLEREIAQYAANPKAAEYVATLRQELADISQATGDNTKLIADTTQQLNQLDTQLESARKAFKAFSAEQVATTPESLQADIAAVQDTTDPVASQAAARRFVNLAMADTVDLDLGTITRLIDDTKTSFTLEQRDYLRTLVDSRIAENALKDAGKVSQEVLYGSPKGSVHQYTGIKQYRERIAADLQANKLKQAEARLAKLEAFMRDHRQKASLLEQVLGSVAKDRKQRQVLRRRDGGWIINEGQQLDKTAVYKNGGVTVHPNTPAGFLEQVRNEVTALEAAHKELRTAVDLKIAAATPATAAQGESLDVQNQPQAQGKESAPEPVQPSTPAPQAATAAQGTAETVAPVATTEQPVIPTATTQDDAQAQPKASPAVEPVQATQAQYDEAVRIKESTDPLDYDTVSGDVAPIVAALVQGNPVEIVVGEEEVATLTRMTETSPAGTPYIDRNLVADFFKQAKKKTGHASVRPLVAVKDFLSKWQNGEVSVDAFLDTRKSLNQRQVAALEYMRDALAQLAPRVQKHLQVNPKLLQAQASGDAQALQNERELLSQDMLQFLITQDDTGTANVDENVKTAIAYAAYHWLLMQSTAGALTKEQINEMNGRDKDAPMSLEGEQALRGMVGNKDFVISVLGRTALQALGLKAIKDAPQDLQPKLEMALGTHALRLLEDVKYVKRTTITKTQLNTWFGESNEKVNKEQSQTFVEMVPGEKAHATLAEMRDINKETGGIVERLFGAEHAPRFATTAPVKFTDQTARDSNQKISDTQRKAIEQTMATPHKVIPDMLKTMLGMGREQFLQIAGWEAFDPTKHSITRKESMEAKNQGLEKQYDLMLEMLDNPDNPNGRESEFYVQQYVMKNFRAGFTTESLNQQVSKIHRYMFARPSWTATLDLTKQEQIKDFLIAFAQSIGVSIDKQTNAITIDEKLAKELQDPELQEAIAILRRQVVGRTVEEKWSPEEAALVAKVAGSREGMMTLQGLVAYANYQAAMDAGAKSVDITMLVGADGKTSGPMLTHLALGAASDVDGLMDVLAMGGMYKNTEDAPKHFSDFYARATSMDLYESLGAKFLIHAQKAYRSTRANIDALIKTGKRDHAKKLFTDQEWAAVEVLTKPLLENGKTTKSGRNLTKTPLTSFGFGSGLGASMRGMKDKLRASITETAEAIIAGDRKDVTLADLTAAVNVLLEKGAADVRATVVGLPQDMDAAAWLAQVFTPAQEEALNNAFDSILGNAVKDTMRSYFEVLITRRDGINKTTQAAFFTYHTLYQDARQKEVERLMEAGEIAYRMQRTGAEAGKKKIPLHDMTPVQETAFRKKYAKLLPVMHSGYSLQQDNLDMGLYLAKFGSTAQANPLYHSKVQLGGERIVNAKGDKVAHLTSDAWMPVEQDPGVIGSSYPIHASDSAIMHTGLLEVAESLNVHDEIGNNFLKIKDAARAVNKAVATTFLSYSPAREAFNMFERTAIEAARLIAKGELDKALVPQLFKAWAATYNRGEYDTDRHVKPDAIGPVLLQYLFDHATEADTLRLQALAQMGTVDQYPWEGGQFNDPAALAAVRKEAEAKLKELPAAPSDTLRKALAYLESVQRVMQGQATTEVEFSDDAEDVTQLENTAVVGLPGASAQPIVEAMTQQVPAVAEAATQGTPVTDAVNALPIVERAAAIEQITRTVAKMPATAVNPWGLLGQPNVAPDTTLEAWFVQHPVSTAREVIPMLRKIIKERNAALLWTDAQYEVALQLLDRFGKAGIAALPVYYVTPDTDPAIAVNGIVENARGWYAADGSGLFIKSSDFVGSGLKPELLLHELVHASLSAAVANPTKETQPLIDELTELLNAADAYVKANGLQVHAKKVTTVDELLAYGLTDETFQNEVLKKLSVTSKNWGNKLVDGMTGLIKTIVNFLFKHDSKSQQQKAENGLTVLVANAAGLFAQAEQANRQAGKRMVNHAMASTGTQTYTMLGLHDALASPVHPLDATFNTHLRKVLTSIVDRLHGPFGSFLGQSEYQQAGSPMAAWLKALYSGKAPFASKAYTSGFLLNDQVAFAMEQVEVTVKAALDTEEVATRTAYSQLSKLYTEVKAKLQVSDFHDGNWAAATQEEVARAQALHDFLFALEQDKTGRSDYLARFAALGLSHPQVNKLLQMNTAIQGPSGQRSFAVRLQDWFESILNFFQDKITGTYAGQKASDKLQTLVTQLVDIEAKRRSQIAAQQAAFDWTGPVEEATRELVEKARGKIVDVMNSPIVRKQANGYIAGAGAAVRTLAGNRVNDVLDNLNRLRDSVTKQRHGIVTSLVNEVRGHGKQIQLLALAAKHREAERKRLISQHAKAALEAFANDGKDLTKEQKAAISAVFMRTGAHHLLDTVPLVELQNLLTTPAALQAKIDGVIAQLSGSQTLKDLLVEQAAGLGHLRAVGRTPNSAQLLNAHNIARMIHSPYAAKIDPAMAAHNQPLLAQLISLYGIHYSDSVDRQQAATVLATELARIDGGNGIEYVLKTMRNREQQALERLFGNNPVQMIHGHVPEILDPHTELRIATAAEGQDLEDQGYVRGAEVAKDPKDKDPIRKYLYVRHGGGMQRYQTSAISLTDLGTKGALQHDGTMSLYTAHGLANAAKQAQLTVDALDILKQIGQRNPTRNMSMDTVNAMVPLLNDQGQIVNWRYLMQENTKDTILKRDNRFEHLLGAIDGALYDKTTTRENNVSVLQALQEEFTTNFATRSDSFVEISDSSSDPEMREIWRLLPDDAKQDVRRIWGRDGMQVRIDMLDIVFGYRKWGAATQFERANKERMARNLPADAVMELQTINLMGKAFVGAVEWGFESYARLHLGMDQAGAERYTKRSAWRVSQAERAWQEVVREVKDIFVVKNITTLVGNLRSNVSLMLVFGVSPSMIAKEHLVALKGATAWRHDQQELTRLTALRDAGHFPGMTAGELDTQILRLQDALARNPIRELVEAGLMPTIVEDLADDSDIYSYKGKMQEWAEAKTAKLPEGVRASGRWLYMTHDTALYQGLSRITQLSDFAGRYTLYKHLTTRTKNRLSKEDAILQASEAFINYDTPMHRGMQYMDDMGFFMFTKYFLRIQRVLLKLSRENPARVLGLALLDSYMNLGPIVTDSHFIAHFGNNPLESGALKYPGALPELATVKALTLWK